MRRKAYSKNERGVALFLCLFALLLLSCIGLGMMFMSSTETTINYNYRSSMQSYYAARAGVYEGVDRLRTGSTGSYPITPPAAMPSNSATTGVTYIINPTGSESVQPWNASNQYFDNELCNEYFLSSGGSNLLGVSPAGAGIPCSTAVTGTYYTTINSASSGTGTAAAMPYKWVRITQKQNKTTYPFCPNGSCTTNPSYQVCWDGQHEITATACTATTPPVYLVTALAKTSRGSRRMYQAEYAPTPPLQVSSAVASQAGVNLTGSLTVNGYDACTCLCTTSGSGGNQTTTCNDRPGMTCDRTKAAIMSAGNVDNPNSSETVIAGTGPIVENLHSSYPTGLNAQSLIDQFSPGGTVVQPDSSGNYCRQTGACGTLPSPFPPTNPSTATSNGQTSVLTPVSPATGIDLTGGGGSGVLIVNGDLTIHGGGFQWYGLILVKGTVTFQGGGSAGTNIVGAVIAGQDANANSDTTLGGSVVINLDTCAIANSFKNQPLHFIAARELLY